MWEKQKLAIRLEMTNLHGGKDMKEDELKGYNEMVSLEEQVWRLLHSVGSVIDSGKNSVSHYVSSSTSAAFQLAR